MRVNQKEFCDKEDPNCTGTFLGLLESFVINTKPTKGVDIFE